MRPESDEALAVAAAQGLGAVAQSMSLNSATASQCDQPSRRKRLANLQAHFALKGFTLHPLAHESLIVGKWGLTRVLPDMPAAERFLAQIGGSHG